MSKTSPLPKEASMSFPLLRAIAVAALAFAGPASAHHAINAQFDVSKTLEMKGTLTKVDWVNPHAYFHFAVKDDASGAVSQWSFETPPPAGLRRAGLGQRDALPIGQAFGFTFNPSRNGDKVGLLATLIYPDGRRVSMIAKNGQP